ncbi:hypothetical protein F4802DRAFT_348882 [Xylaria palmicola]|nr:hypothetical protein F4802DRAFT_348882 [Xylaria palmicola]
MQASTVSTRAERSLRNWAQLYSLYVLDNVKDRTPLTAGRFNTVTDRWVQSVAPEVRLPTAVEYICGVCVLFFSEEWIATHLGPVLTGLGLGLASSDGDGDGDGDGRLAFFEYLVWRFRRHAGERRERAQQYRRHRRVEYISEAVENIHLD